MPPSNEEALYSPNSPNNMTTSIDSLTSKLTVSPQIIPESQAVDHSLDRSIEDISASPIQSPTVEALNGLSRNSSTRSLRSSRAAKIPGSRRASRRSTSNTSVSPAQAFLASWNRDNSLDAVADPKADDEGQAIGMNNEYIIGRTISRGGFGVVKEVHTISQHGRRIVRAVKIVPKRVAGQSEAGNDKVQQDLEHEVSVWRYLKHRHVLGLEAVYDTDYATFCVMDLNIGGTLFDLVRQARQRRQGAQEGEVPKGLDPRLAKRYAYQLACALRYLHEDIRVCHRDVKLENCLIDTTAPEAMSEGGNLRLCDFGLADFLHSGSIDDTASEFSDDASLAPPSHRGHMRTTSSVIGTLEYASPKGLSVHRKLFETAGDVWAFGVIVYALCTGDLPFRHPMPSKTVELILQADWDHDALKRAAGPAEGEEVIELVQGCLEREIEMRWTIGECLKSPWFDGCREPEERPKMGRDGDWS